MMEQVQIGAPVWRKASAPSFRWLVLWLAWAAGTAVFSPTGSQAVWWVALFAVVAGAVIAIHDSNGELGLARTLLGGFVVFVAISLAARALDPATNLGSPGDRLSLLALEANQLVRIAGAAALGSAYLALTGMRSASMGRIASGVLGGVACLAVVYAGGSRTGTAALVLSLIVFAIALAPQPRQRTIAVAGLALGAAALAVGLFVAGGLSPLVGNFEAIASRESESALDQSREIQSLNGRLEIWPEIIEEANLVPVTGYGIGSDRDIVTTLYAQGRIGWLAQHTHNLFLQVLLTTGYVGLMLMAAALVSAAARSFSGSPLGPALLVLILVDGISEAAIRVPAFGWFSLLAAAVVAGDLARTSANR